MYISISFEFIRIKQFVILTFQNVSFGFISRFLHMLFLIYALISFTFMSKEIEKQKQQQQFCIVDFVLGDCLSVYKLVFKLQ